MTWVPDGAVKLRMTDSAQGSIPPITVMAALKETAERVPNRIALGEFHQSYQVSRISLETPASPAHPPHH